MCERLVGGFVNEFDEEGVCLFLNATVFWGDGGL